MGLQKIGFEGQTAGVAISTANSDDFGDSILSAAVAASGATLTYASDWSAHGTRSAKIANGVAGSTAILGYSFAATPSCAQRVYLRFDALPTTTSCNIMQFRNSPDSSANGITLTPGGLLSVASAESGSAKYQGTYVLQPNTAYRLESGETLAAGTGRMWAKLFLGDSTTPIAGATYDSGTTLTNNTVQPNFGSSRVGKLTSTAVMSNLWLDEWAVVDGSAAEIGPVSTSSLHIGSGLVTAAYVGGSPVTRMYLGATQIFG